MALRVTNLSGFAVGTEAKPEIFVSIGDHTTDYNIFNAANAAAGIIKPSANVKP